MTAAVPGDVASRRPAIGRIVVWIVAAVLFAYVTAQGVGNLVGVQRLIGQFNGFVSGTGVASRDVPWALLVIDVLVAPAGFVVALLVSRRLDLRRTCVVFLTALCAVSAVWFSIAQAVLPYVTLPALG